jgi:hypothetical protein
VGVGFGPEGVCIPLAVGECVGGIAGVDEHPASAAAAATTRIPVATRKAIEGPDMVTRIDQ